MDFLMRIMGETMAFGGKIPLFMSQLNPFVLTAISMVSASLAMLVSCKLPDTGFIVKTLIFMAILVFSFAILLGFAYLTPVLFSMDGLIKSQSVR